MPKLWNDTIDAHRAAVREATLETAAALVAERGVRSVTMSEIAERAGIGRATLYKYFPDIDSILRAWHDRQVGAHVAELAAARDRASAPLGKLEAVLEAYAFIARESHGHQDAELAAFLHRDERVRRAEREVHGMVVDLIAAAAESGDVREDIAPAELAAYSLHALAAAATLRSKNAVRRLVDVTMAGLRPAAGGVKP